MTPALNVLVVLQFSSLEPEIVCRLLYVKDVELIPSAAGAGPALPAPPGQTELPACPVCLERLDEHISGIATTVSHIASATAMQLEQQDSRSTSCVLTILFYRCRTEHRHCELTVGALLCRFAITASTASACSAGGT